MTVYARKPKKFCMATTSKKSNVVGKNVLHYRKLKGITQLALGQAIQWKGEDAGAQISRFESGKMSPQLKTLAKLAKALGVTVIDLMTPQK